MRPSIRQQKLFGITEYENLLPTYPSFKIWLIAHEKTKDEISKILLELDQLNVDCNKNELLFLLKEFALDSMINIKTPTSREEKKELCRCLYLKLSSKTAMKRSDIIKTIARKMNVNTDCIQVYLREIVNADRILNPTNPNQKLE